ncbi:hypothetical protein A2160_00435 [Candidatus Beckwithbacteria bacterium RBG_13_42_9]|uniref:Addiction module toxin RelE n=1 Tax=Candidatus Beckwithbacteria bacterium RBG_13_42_9 TaxID=1797457 RepID=A0A1F5E3T6_9BACT|nr:MAG: hypothetical protein A2160_00435 [Candidatus Beckwithbacteria bacterium RBG_13_42_9]
MKLEYKPQVLKQLKKISLNEKKKIIRKLENLLEDPLAGKPLKGELEGLKSLRAWPYRIIYQLNKKSIVIFSISHRQSAYK